MKTTKTTNKKIIEIIKQMTPNDKTYICGFIEGMVAMNQNKSLKEEETQK